MRRTYQNKDVKETGHAVLYIILQANIRAYNLYTNGIGSGNEISTELKLYCISKYIKQVTKNILYEKVGGIYKGSIEV